MDFALSPRAQELLERVDTFIEREIAPREETHHREQLALQNPWVVPPLVEELKAKAAVPAATEAANAPLSDAEIRDMTPMAELQSQLKVNRIEIANREQALQLLAGQIGDYQARLNREPVREQQLADLTRNYDQTRANYDSLLKKRNDSELATSLERRQQGEHFRILDPPSLPVKPYSPDRFKFGLVGLVAGIVLGAAVSAVAEMVDDCLYDEKVLKEMLPVDVIAEIPAIVTPREEKSCYRLAWLGWAVTGLEFALILAGLTVSYLRG